MPEDGSGFETTYNVTSLDVELLKREVGQRFPFYDTRVNINSVAFFCRIDGETLDEKFESLRKSLSERGYIPMIRLEKGEHVIFVIQKPKIKRRSIWINIVLLIATIFTTTLAGSILWVGIYEPSLVDPVDALAKSILPFYLWKGFIFFSVPLLSILGIHEMGHYLISKRHNLETSLPYFIPIPPPFILGTFGALISTREPIPNRKALLDVGVSGPICGFIVAILVSIIGLFLMQQNPIPVPADAEGGFIIVYPLILQGLSNFFTIPSDIIIHPTLFAGWVGFFLTSVNLLPLGQLDGGHVARALLKDKHKYASWAVIIMILILGLFWTGWLFYAFFLIFLIGTQHQPPLNEITPLDPRRKIIGIIALVIFIICFAPIPIIV